MNTTVITTPLCGYCGRPVIAAAPAVYNGGRAYHAECTRGPVYQQQFQAPPLTEETVRQIVREDLAVLSDAVVAMAEDGWLYCGPEGLDEAQEKCLKAYRLINAVNVVAKGRA